MKTQPGNCPSCVFCGIRYLQGLAHFFGDDVLDGFPDHRPEFGLQGLAADPRVSSARTISLIWVFISRSTLFCRARVFRTAAVSLRVTSPVTSWAMDSRVKARIWPSMASRKGFHDFRVVHVYV